MRKLFRFNVTKDTIEAIIAIVVMVSLSLMMLPFGGDSFRDTIISFILRDILMILGLGIVFISLYVEKRDSSVLEEMGFTKKKWLTSLIINILLAVGLLAMFISDEVPKNVLSIENLYGAVYILVAGIFEMTFIYGFIRMSFEKAFGILPSIVLTSVFYSLHHAGFQPEFMHLFFVGMMYCTVFYITKNMLIIFPFFWGVGAMWDVLISSEAGNEIKNIDSFVIALIIIVTSIIWIIYRKMKKSQNEGGPENVIKNINCDHGNA
ncbi:MAG: hypothetical protein J6M65_02840 [Eubacterium sp.]|nr:hypothetical protein [Eubacterium sp.]